MDNREQELLRKALEAARQKLTNEQRQELDRFCQDLKERKIYTHTLALEAERVIRTERENYKCSELQHVIEKAEGIASQQRELARIEAERQKEYLEQKAEGQRAARERDVEKLKQQDAEEKTRVQQEPDAEKLATPETPRDEPLPDTARRINTALAESNVRRAQLEAEKQPNALHEPEKTREQQLLDNAKKLEQEDEVAAALWVAQAESLDRQRRQFGRYDELGGFRWGGGGVEGEGQLPDDPTPHDPTGSAPASEAAPTPRQSEVQDRTPSPIIVQTQEQVAVAPTGEQEAGAAPLPIIQEQTGLMADFVAAETKEITATPTQEQQHEAEAPPTPPLVEEIESGGVGIEFEMPMQELVGAQPAPEQQHEAEVAQQVSAPEHESDIVIGLAPTNAPEQVSEPILDQEHEPVPQPVAQEKTGLMADFVPTEAQEQVAAAPAPEQPREVEPSRIQAGEPESERDFMADFVTAETKEQVAAEHARKEIEQQFRETGPSLTM